MSRNILAFEIEGIGYGLPLEAIREVCLPLCSIPIPRAPALARGLINLRGELVLLVDMAWWLHGKPQTIRESSRILLMQPGISEATGLMVDRLDEVRKVHGSDFSGVVGTREDRVHDEWYRAMSSGVCQWGDRVITMIDPGKLAAELTKIMAENELRQLRNR